jgi:hypothetical protein
MKDVLDGRYKNELSKNTFVENQFLLLENSLLKNTQDKVPVRSTTDLRHALRHTGTEIQRAQYNIKRCMDNGELHIELYNRQPREFEILTGSVPSSFKI